jgi:hypothetical protein
MTTTPQELDALIAELLEHTQGTSVAEFKDFRDPLRLKSAAALRSLRDENARLTLENGNLAQQYAKIKQALGQANHVRDVFASAVVMQAAQEVDKMPNPQGSPVDKSTKLQGPDPNGVICPNCVHQFRAIPVNVQAQLRCAEAESARLMAEIQVVIGERDALRADAERLSDACNGMIGLVQLIASRPDLPTGLDDLMLLSHRVTEAKVAIDAALERSEK